MNDPETYYDILEVSESSTQDEIKKSFHKLAQEYHPDKSSNATDSVKRLAEEKFKEIKDAYDVLNNVGKRKQYDAKIREFKEKTQKVKEPPQSNTSQGSQKNKTQTYASSRKLTAKHMFWIVVGISVFIGISLSGDSTSNVSDTTSNNIQASTIPINNTNNNQLKKTDTVPAVTSKKSVIVPKTDDQICKDKSGIFATYNSSDKTCGCSDGYIVDKNTNQCVTPLKYCQNKQGLNATYNLADNSCGCAAGYYYGATSNQCVSLVEYRDQSCFAKYPNTSFLKYSDDGQTKICDCNSGYYWSNDRTSCMSQDALNQQCISSYGTGGYSTKENGKNVCDCSYGYSFNAQRNLCVTTSSIDEICVRDVGRNSHYLGTVTDGKYNCSNPY